MTKPFKFFKELNYSAYSSANFTIDRGTVQAYVYKEDDTLYLTFTASNSDLDWYNHFFSLGYKVPNTKDRIHVGWYLAYSCVQEDIFNVLASRDFKKLVLVGHSYGGALARITGYFLKDLYPDLKIITSGSPRPGNKSFHRAIEKNLGQCYYYGSDIVPFLPPWLASTKASHLGERKLKDAFKNIWYVIKTIIKSKNIQDIDKAFFYQDHMLDFYDDNMEIEV
jgi:pimeloyl-ACP methyl ester carboxylesterase